MKKLLMFACLLATVACTGSLDENSGQQTPELRYATIGVSGESSDADSSRTVFTTTGSLIWSDGDCLSLFQYRGNGTTLDKELQEFNLTEGVGRTAGKFSGVYTPATSRKYMVYYPHDSNLRWNVDVGCFIVNIVPTQKYVADGFAGPSFPMGGVINDIELDASVSLYNLCGVLKIQLTGNKKVAQVQIQGGKGETVSGYMLLDYSVEKAPVLKYFTRYNNSTMVLNCGDGGAQLDPVQPTAFNIILRPESYEGLKITIIDTEGNIMTKTTTKTITVERSKVTTIKAFEFAPSSGVDLNTYSIKGHSNCYNTRYPNVHYTFDARYRGNSTVPDIDPKSAGLLWETGAQGDVIVPGSIELNDGRISFKTSSKTAGNAVIAAYSGENCTGDILWSWHIWSYDDIRLKEYTGGLLPEGKSYRMLASPLGATTTNMYDINNVGLYYEWGRKDPFVGANEYNIGSKTNYTYMTTTPTIDWVGAAVAKTEATGNIEYSIKNPTSFVYTDKTFKYEGSVVLESDAQCQEYWDWLNVKNDNLWSNPDGSKTIYDPCPIGYKVSPYEMTLSLIKSTASEVTTVTNPVEYSMYDNASSPARNVVGSFNQYGCLFNCGNGSEYVDQYPTNGRMEYVEGRLRIHNSTDQCRFSSAEAYGTVGRAHCLYMRNYNGKMSIQPISLHGGAKASGSPVRCVREEGVDNE